MSAGLTLNTGQGFMVLFSSWRLFLNLKNINTAKAVLTLLDAGG